MSEHPASGDAAAASPHESAPSRRPRWSLMTLMLLTAAVGTWTARGQLSRRASRMAEEITTMRRLARELVVADPTQIAAIELPERWYDEDRFEIHLPPGEFRLRLATREIPEGGELPARELASAPLKAGGHRFELKRRGLENGDVELSVVTEDGDVLLRTVESDWDQGDGWSFSGSLRKTVHRDPARPLVLIRRRFMTEPRANPNQGKTTPKTPCNGILLWLERES